MTAPTFTWKNLTACFLPDDLGVDLVEDKYHTEADAEDEAKKDEALGAAEPVGIPGRHEDGLLLLQPLVKGEEEALAPLVVTLEAGLHRPRLWAALEPGQDVWKMGEGSL